MRSLKGKVLSGILCGALVLGLVPGFGMKVDAAEQVTILEEGFEKTEISTTETKTGWSTTVKNASSEDPNGFRWIIRGGKEGTGNSLDSVDESGEKESGANGSEKYAYHNWYNESDRLTNELISPVINLGNMSSCSLTFYFMNRFDHEEDDEIGKDYLGVFYRVGNDGEWNSITKITDEHKEWTKVTYSLPAGALKNDVQIAFQADVQYGYGVYVDEVSITGVKKEAAPEKAADVTPTKDNDNSKTYKNEWVNGQWYDANGKTSYKYKGEWKRNSIGWWYEDASGWYPSNMWQKIDGKWYYFHKDGYMAESEYAGGWSQYSEGHWWVGADGAWDGSEPGVWRLVGTKWWFKDSTGWYAKGKWYKIGGTWYEFDNDGWWIEK